MKQASKKIVNPLYREPSPPPVKPPPPPPPFDWSPIFVIGGGAIILILMWAISTPTRSASVVTEHISWVCTEHFGHSTRECGYGYNAISGHYEYDCENGTEWTSTTSSRGADVEIVCPDISNPPDRLRREDLIGTVTFREGRVSFQQRYAAEVLRGYSLNESCAANYNIFGSLIEVRCP